VDDASARLIALLESGLASWRGRRDPRPRPPAQPVPSPELDPFAVLGIPATADFDEVHAAWRQRLAEYHPDRFQKAGEKIRRLALSETERLNAAYQAIARDRTAKRS
jgi:DnaJ-domain-containing protein 1